PRSASFVSLYGPPPPSLSPLSLHDALPISWIAFFLTVYAGLAMVSNAPFYSGKSFALGRSVPFWVMLVVVGGFVFVSADPPLVLFGLFVLYGVSGWVIMAWRWNRARHLTRMRSELPPSEAEQHQPSRPEPRLPGEQADVSPADTKRVDQ